MPEMESTIYVVAEGKHEPSEMHSLSLPAKRCQEKKHKGAHKKVQCMFILNKYSYRGHQYHMENSV